jgi:hypothetical protein
MSSAEQRAQHRNIISFPRAAVSKPIQPQLMEHTLSMDIETSKSLIARRAGLLSFALSCLIHASCWARTLPAGGGGCAVGSLPPPPPPKVNLDLQCGADHHPSSPFALYGSSVGQRGIFAQSNDVKRPNSLYLQHKLSPCPDALRHLSPLHICRLAACARCAQGTWRPAPVEALAGRRCRCAARSTARKKSTPVPWPTRTGAYSA